MKKTCKEIGCNKIATNGSYCLKHWNNKKSLYSSSRWKKTRAIKKQMNPLCEICEKKDIVEMATLIHHKKDGEIFKDLFFDLDNLMSLCVSCHNKIHGNKSEMKIKNKNSGIKIKFNWRKN